jgi:regulator of RNase E activity RraA
MWTEIEYTASKMPDAMTFLGGVSTVSQIPADAQMGVTYWDENNPGEMFIVVNLETEEVMRANCMGITFRCVSWPPSS